MDCLLILAQEGGAAPQGPNFGTLLLPLGAIFLIYYFILLRPRSKEQKQRQGMLNELKKYDKVVTIGGVMGTVMEVREKEVILKVDDSSNTRIKFLRSSIQRVLTDEAEKADKAANNPSNADG